MKCRNCPKVATLHITEVVKGVVQEHHLCEDCARPFLEKTSGSSALPAGAGKSADDDADQEAFAQLLCPSCGMSYKEFRTIGRLGCSQCYMSFQDELLPLIENIHGETQHAGKSPRKTTAEVDEKQISLRKLRGDLRQAVTEELYEKAAELRDQIQALEAELSREPAE
jgi:protein arginine kinase activator